jgi:hypothetical protein
MTMSPYNGNLTQSLKWLQNNAPNIQSLTNQKYNWYSQFQTQFWSNWYTNVFNLATANSFGLMVWCVILGVPSQLFGIYPLNNSFAYGAYRQNYVYSGVGYAITNPNMQGGNYYGGGDTTVINLNEVRQALQLRYAALVSNGKLSFINRMLAYIFNGGLPFTQAQFVAGEYFYVADPTVQPVYITSAMIYDNGVLVPTSDYTIDYTTGLVTFTTAPMMGMLLTWAGEWGTYSFSTPALFGTGNGTTTMFYLPTVQPINKPYYIEYHIGANMGISSEFINLLNSPQYAIAPVGAGSSYLVIQDM